jgi:hypothetical protein
MVGIELYKLAIAPVLIWISGFVAGALAERYDNDKDCARKHQRKRNH